VKNTNTSNLDKVTEIFNQVRDLETTNEQKKHKIQEQAKQIIDNARRESDENYESNIFSTKDEIQNYLKDVEHKIISQENEQSIKNRS
jgi:F0F1-type ATP synthase membrane subunit b/b'